MTKIYGRDQEIAALQEVLDAAAEGPSRVVLLEGETGMGKTTLVTRTAELAREREYSVASGRCWEDLDTPAYWVWSQVLETIDPGLQRALQDVGDRFELFRRIGEALQIHARDRPLLLALEDLHVADEASVLLLRSVIELTHDARVGLLCTFDPSGLPPRSPVGALLRKVSHDATHLVLGGIDETAIAALYAAVAGQDLSGPMTSAIAEMSEGNPLFVVEAARLMVTRGDVRRPDHSTGFRVPEGIKGLVRARLALLPVESREILGVAAVLGRQFDVGLLAEVAQVDLDPLLDLLQGALDTRLIEEQSALGTYRFTHVLLRETLYEDLTAARRMRLHRVVAEVLETRSGDRSDEDLAVLAHHWFKAAQAGDLAKTVDYSSRAARRAMAAQAFEDAARLFRRALKAAHSGAVAEDEMVRLKQELADALDRSGGPDQPSAQAPAAEATFLSEGDVWLLDFEGRTARIKDMKGLYYLARLLADPGREIHSIELTQLAGGGVVRTDATPEATQGTDPFSDLGEVLDAQGRARFKARISELEEEIAEAEAYNDHERAAGAREEMSAIVDELSRAAGLGGRSRRTGSPAERARINVTRTIKEALRRMNEVHPELGRHLEATVHTGTFCSYMPDPRAPLTWRTSGSAAEPP